MFLTHFFHYFFHICGIFCIFALEKGFDQDNDDSEFKIQQTTRGTVDDWHLGAHD